VRRAVRDNRRAFAALGVMLVLALGVTGYVLSNQRFYLPAWVPLVGTDFYELEAELETGQAVVPGQGQSVNIAGVKVGEVGRVELENGRALVELKIRRKYAPAYQDATVLLRPKTGLKDMALSLDPGTKSAGKLKEGSRIGVASTLPDVNTDELLAQLDGDTRAYLRVLLGAGAEAFAKPDPRTGESAAADLREDLKRLEPTSRDVRLITAALATRRHNVRRVVHNFQQLATEVGSKDRQLAGLVDSANANFQALAAEEGHLRQSVRLLPSTLGQTETTLRKASDLAGELGPTLQHLRPAARSLGPSLRATRPFLRQTTPIIRTQLRPFARDVRPVVRDLRRAAGDLAVAAPRGARALRVVNWLLNELAYNPRGAEEGFLFWLAWANHAGGTLFTAQDAHGPVRRGVVLASCSALTLLQQIAGTTPQLEVLIDLLNPPQPKQVCTP
jgi:phospholipid/cholesterol/gamma-HCH transport system substrate-binding protein